MNLFARSRWMMIHRYKRRVGQWVSRAVSNCMTTTVETRLNVKTDPAIPDDQLVNKLREEVLHFICFFNRFSYLYSLLKLVRVQTLLIKQRLRLWRAMQMVNVKLLLPIHLRYFIIEMQLYCYQYIFTICRVLIQWLVCQLLSTQRALKLVLWALLPTRTLSPLPISSLTTMTPLLAAHRLSLFLLLLLALLLFQLSLLRSTF